jgi:hypothetical protein
MLVIKETPVIECSKNEKMNSTYVVLIERNEHTIQNLSTTGMQQTHCDSKVTIPCHRFLLKEMCCPSFD